MATFNSLFDRSNANTREVLEYQTRVVGEILDDAEATSVALQLADVHRMTTYKERFRFLNSQPQAFFINGTTSAGDAPLGSSNNDDTNQPAKDSGLKQTTNFQYDYKEFVPDEIAVMVPMPDAWRDDSEAAWEEVRRQLKTAFARQIDAALLFGASTSAHPIPSTFGNGVVNDAIAAGNVIYLADHLASSPTDGTVADRADAYAAVAQLIDGKGYVSTNFVVAPSESWNLKRQRNTDGALLNAEGIFGLSVSEVRNGTWDATTALALTGAFTNMKVGVKQDLTFTLSNTAVITDAAGNVTYNAWQQDGEVLRAVMRLGYTVLDPLKGLTGAREFPFAVLAPGSAPAS